MSRTTSARSMAKRSAFADGHDLPASPYPAPVTHEGHLAKECRQKRDRVEPRHIQGRASPGHADWFRPMLDHGIECLAPGAPGPMPMLNQSPGINSDWRYRRRRGGLTARTQSLGRSVAAGPATPDCCRGYTTGAPIMHLSRLSRGPRLGSPLVTRAHALPESPLPLPGIPTLRVTRHKMTKTHLPRPGH